VEAGFTVVWFVYSPEWSYSRGWYKDRNNQWRCEGRGL